MGKVVSVSILVLVILVATALPVYGSVATREITIIEKMICFDVSISDPITNEAATKSICVVIAFHILNAEPSNETINVEFPVEITIGNNTITRKVVVPLLVKGEVVRIEVKGQAGYTEGVIIVAPSPTPTTPAPRPTPTTPTSSAPTPTTPTTARTPLPVPAVTVTVTRSVGAGVGVSAEDVVPVVAVVAVVVGAGIYVWRRRVRRVEEKPREEEYEEAVRLLKRELEERERELEKVKRSILFKLMCKSCNSLVSPIITDDNRLLCPQCRSEIARIGPDGRLELQ